MVNYFTQKPDPYLFKGGNASEYEVFVGKAGTWCTRHITSKETIQSVQPENDMFGIANLGLNILNLGVGIYNAFQLRKVGKKLDQVHDDIQTGFDKLEDKLNRSHEYIQSGFDKLEDKLDRNHEYIQSCFNSIYHALIVQHRTLELLVSNQNNIAKQMDILRKEMHTGFQNVIEEVKDVEARRRREEFETRTFKVLKAYERFTYLLPELTEANQLIERAEDLEAWLRSQLNRINLGQPERLPLMVALAFSVRAKADAFEAKEGEYINFAIKEIKLLIDDIRNEVNAFCEGRTLYELGVEMPEIIYQYALLNRSLRKGIECQKQIEFESLFSENEVTWDDSMQELRELFQANPENTEIIYSSSYKIALETLTDYDWYIGFSGKDRLTFSVHSCPSIPLKDILETIGHPAPTTIAIEKTAINKLMSFALPNVKEEVSQLIQSEFQLDKTPLLGSKAKKLDGKI